MDRQVRRVHKRVARSDWDLARRRGATVSSDYLNPKWQKKRLQIMERDRWRCVACGDSDSPLHVHHIRYAGKPWDVDDCDLQTLCERCHSHLGKHPKAGVFYAQGIPGVSDVSVTFLWCPECGCWEPDCHSGVVSFTCGCNPYQPIPKWLSAGFVCQSSFTTSDTQFHTYECALPFRA